MRAARIWAWARVGALLSLSAISAASLAACGSKGATTNSKVPPAPPRVLIDAGRHLLRLGNTSAAEQLFAQAIAGDPRDPVAHYDLGVAYEQAGDRADALRQYRLALASTPNYTPALFNQAVLIAPHNAPLAIFYYRRIISMRPDAPTAMLNLALLQAATHWPRKVVVAELSKAVALDPALRASIPSRLRPELSVPRRRSHSR